MCARDYGCDSQPGAERADKTRSRGSLRSKADVVSILLSALRDPDWNLSIDSEAGSHLEQKWTITACRGLCCQAYSCSR